MDKRSSKVIIITGALSGIGEAVARLLAGQGHKLILAARRLERLQTLTGEIVQAGGEAEFQTCDVTSAVEMKQLARFALERYGRIDVLVNNAGVMPVSMLHELKVDEWDQMLDVNIKGVLYGIAAVLPAMRAMADQMSSMAISPASIARAIAYAINEPEDTSVNEIVIRPTILP